LALEGFDPTQAILQPRIEHPSRQSGCNGQLDTLEVAEEGQFDNAPARFIRQIEQQPQLQPPLERLNLVIRPHGLGRLTRTRLSGSRPGLLGPTLATVVCLTQGLEVQAQLGGDRRGSLRQQPHEADARRRAHRLDLLNSKGGIELKRKQRHPRIVPVQELVPGAFLALLATFHQPCLGVRRHSGW
jgi:hypothetical protein